MIGKVRAMPRNSGSPSLPARWNRLRSSGCVASACGRAVAMRRRAPTACTSEPHAENEGAEEGDEAPARAQDQIDAPAHLRAVGHDRDAEAERDQGRERGVLHGRDDVGADAGRGAGWRDGGGAGVHP